MRKRVEIVQQDKNEFNGSDKTVDTASGDREETAKADQFDVAIIGGGFSGLCTAYHLLSHGGTGPRFRCAIIEPSERLGAGLAFRTDSPRHLLNVRAKGMSLTDNDSCSFVDWLRNEAPEFSADDFVPRPLYRRYANDCLKQAVDKHGAEVLICLQDEVLAIKTRKGDGRHLLELKSGRETFARLVVLAVGNLPPKTSMDCGPLRSPWSKFNDYSKLRSLAIVGAGLTAMDVILEAEANGFTGSYFVISPHGQFPMPHNEPHVPIPPALREWAAEVAASRPGLRSVLRAFQQRRRSGVDWEHLVDSFRRHSPALWGGFQLKEKRRFLKHMRKLWNIHLHRTCRTSMDMVTRLKESGRLEQIAARVVEVERLEGGGETAVRLVLRAEHVSTLDADMGINGTGLFSDILRTDSPLVEQLLADGLVQPDDFRLGLKVRGGGHLVAADGAVHPGLFTVGTLRRGEELESTAVPEIRRQVKDMVEEIVDSL
jgi:uncharacterized NAD(P)/FAD-binding protein YdhS